MKPNVAMQFHLLARTGPWLISCAALLGLSCAKPPERLSTRDSEEASEVYLSSAADPSGLPESEALVEEAVVVDANPAPTDAMLIALERYQDRLDENGHYDPHSILEAKEHAERMAELRIDGDLTTDGGLWDWEWLGPGNIGGRVRSLIFDPDDPRHMWLGAVAGGIWETTDAGANWHPVNDFLASLSVGAMTIDPVDPRFIYAGTGEAFGGNGARGSGLPNGVGAFRSTNGGDTWVPLPNTDDWDTVARLVHHPTISGTLYAATDTRIMKSEDWGDTWISDPEIANRWFMDFEIDPDDPDHMVAAGVGTVKVTFNGGTDWSEQVTGGTNDLPSMNSRIEVAIDGQSNVYASLDRNGGELWFSSNGGQSWQRRNTNYDYFIGGGGNSQGNYDNALWVSPVDPNLVVVGGIDLWRSRDGGLTMTKISNWTVYHLGLSAHADQHLIVNHPGYDQSTNRTVLFTNDGGVQRTSNILTVGEVTGWSNLANGLGITQFVGGAASPNGSIVVGGATDNGLSRKNSGEGVNEWHQGLTGDGCSMAVDYENPNNVYGMIQSLSLFKSIDGGGSYLPFWIGCDECGNGEVVKRFNTPMAVSAFSPRILMIGGLSVYLTNTGAESWMKVRSPLADDIYCSAIGMSPSSQPVSIVGYTSGRVSRTENNGSSWTDLDDLGFVTPPDTVVTDIAVHPTRPTEALVSFGGSSDTSGVWLLTNTRGIWMWARRMGSDPEHSLPQTQVNAVLYHPLDPNWIYAGTDVGVFASEDRGATWSRTPRFESVEHDGPVNTVVQDLFFQGKGTLVAATHGRGMFRVRALPTVFVDLANNGPEDGTEFFPYNTVGEGLGASGNGSTMSIKAGTYLGEGLLHFNRRMRIVPTGGTVRVR
ncbi:MAG: hypothetical protein FLDDKLPJ_03585 [Phycisphaerae bacterium]|nr:hypothetical protein [Phycisphaerae bacterium]